MKWGEHVESGFYYKLLSQGKVDEDDKEPELHGLSFYTDAFRELSSCRQFGMGEGPIPFIAIAEYSRLYEVGDFEEFHHVIRVMDNRYLKLRESKTDTSTSKGKNK
jgi:hypothetical protein